jgi:hypothetical protein
MAKQPSVLTHQTQAPNNQAIKAAAVAKAAAAKLPATITAADLVALANTTHGHGKTAKAYHAGNTPCLPKTNVPYVAVNLVRAYYGTHNGAHVVPVAPNTSWGLRGKPGGKRHAIQAAVMAGGSVAEIVALSKANGATAGGLADLVALLWLGCVELVARAPAK